MPPLKQIARGKVVTLQFEFRVLNPHLDYSLQDVATATLTITDPKGNNVVSAVALTHSGITGKYHHHVQTQTGWMAGIYTAVAESASGIYTDTEKRIIFELE